MPAVSAPAGYWGKVVESLFIGPCLAQLAGLVLQEGKRGCVPGTVGAVGLGVMECQLWGLTSPFLWTLSLSCWHNDFAVSSLAQPKQCLEPAPVSPPELCWSASGVNTRNWMRERPEHLPQFGGFCLHTWAPGKICSGKCSGGCSALTFLLGYLMLHFCGGEVHRSFLLLWQHPLPALHMDLGVSSMGMGLSSGKGEHICLLGVLSNAGIT